MNKSEHLKRVLKIIENVPRERILRDLKKGPGWSYHGPHQKIENKIGPGRYLDPITKVENKDLQDDKHWFYYPMLPRYEILCFIPSRSEMVIDVAMKIFGQSGSMAEDINATFDNDIHTLTVSFKDGEIIEVSAPDKLSLAYELYLEALYEQEIMMIPALKDLMYLDDIDESYNDEPTVIYETFPKYLSTPQFERYFEYMDLGKCVGKVRLVEGNFWVVTRRTYIPPHRKLSIKTDKATHVSGLITRVGS
jgi:hypothetical protein